jgi:hypothetical protein
MPLQSVAHGKKSRRKAGIGLIANGELAFRVIMSGVVAILHFFRAG